MGKTLKGHGFSVLALPDARSNVGEPLFGAVCSCGWSASAFYTTRERCRPEWDSHLPYELWVRGTIVVTYSYYEQVSALPDGLNAEDYLELLYSEGEMGIVDDHQITEAEYVTQEEVSLNVVPRV